MKILKKDMKHNEITVLAQNIDDLWYLSHIIDAGDVVKGKTIRKIKMGDSSERNAKITKKTVFLSLNVDRVELKPDSRILRVSGTVREGIEDVPSGSHHSFSIEQNTSISITKEKWLKFQIDKLDESTEEASDVLLCAIDRESAALALLKKYGYKLLAELSGDVAKKGTEDDIKRSFFADVVSKIKEYIERFGIKKVVIASPGFWKQEFMKVLPEEMRKIAVFATCSTSGQAGINEMLKRDELRSALKQDRISAEMIAVESLLKEISKRGLAVYGIEETGSAVDLGAVRTLLVTDRFLFEQKQDENYEKIDSLMRIVESAGADIMIISSDHDGGHKLDGLGGIAALLRYPIN